MKYPEPMRRTQAVRNLNAHRKPQLNTRRTVGDDFVQRFTRHVLHDDVGFVFQIPHFVDGANVGVFDGGGQPCLAQHGAPHLLDGQ